MNVIYEDNHIIAVNKQSGEIVQGDKTGDVPLSDILKAYLKEKYKKPGNVYLGVVHRLDRPVSGVVLFAKTSKALPRLNKLFAEHEKVKKTYWAIVKKEELTNSQLSTLNYQLNNLTIYLNRGSGKMVIGVKDRYMLVQHVPNIYLSYTSTP